MRPEVCEPLIYNHTPPTPSHTSRGVWDYCKAMLKVCEELLCGELEEQGNIETTWGTSVFTKETFAWQKI